MSKSNYRLGKQVNLWNEKAQVVSFIVTEDCNLRCKYCYITHKASGKVMAFETAKKFIDYLFSDAITRQEGIALEFIGGEPCLEMQLIDRICDYFKIKAYEMNSDWYWNYRISICTNGVNYASQEVQNFIKKNAGKLSMTISIDGTKEKHDAQRVFPNGSGSFDIISKSIPLYISQFGGHTKATFSRDDLPHLKECIIALWNMGITDIAANVVFEDVWQPGDDTVFEKQLVELADYAIDNHLFDKYVCTFFFDRIGTQYKEDDLEKTWCGAGKMLALGPDGNIYPCIRYKDYSLNHHAERTIGNVFEDGIDMDKVRPFLLSQIKFQSDDECMNCPIAIGCAFCQGFNYDEAEIPTNLFRAKYICPMHKARVRANDYYFSKLYNLYGIKRDGVDHERRKLFFLLADDYVSYCQSFNDSLSNQNMNYETIIKGLRFARENFFMPVFIHSNNTFSFENCSEFQNYSILHIIPAKYYKEASSLKNSMFVFETTDCQLEIRGLDRCQLNIDSREIDQLSTCVKLLSQKAEYIHINIMNLDSHFDEEVYRMQLFEIVRYLATSVVDSMHPMCRINLLEDIILEAGSRAPEHHGCEAGDKTFVYAPDGHLYLCASHYKTGEEIGTPDEGIIRLKYPHLYKLKNKPLCNECDAYQCNKCLVVNEKYTAERTISPAFQCRKSMIEKDAAAYFAKLRKSSLSFSSMVDPIETLLKNADYQYGFYNTKHNRR